LRARAARTMFVLVILHRVAFIVQHRDGACVSGGLTRRQVATAVAATAAVRAAGWARRSRVDLQGVAAGPLPRVFQHLGEVD